MYEFAPKPKRIREKLWMSVCLFFGVLSYGFGQILPYPMACQLLSVILLTAAVLITVRYLLRDYIYCIDVDENGEAVQLTVVEALERRRTVVCRVSVTDIGQILLATEVANAVSRQEIKKKGLYRYLSQMRSDQSVFLEILDHEKNYFLEIFADQQLISVLKQQKKQYLSDE